MRSSLVLCALLVTALGSCQNQTPEGPAPSAMDPKAAPSEQLTVVRIVGTGFEPLIRANYDDPARTLRVDSTFAAKLGGTPLLSVWFVSSTELGASVPAGMSPGVYDLKVTDPRGRQGSLLAAFRVLGSVSDGRAEGSPDGAPADRGRDSHSWPSCDDPGGCGCGKTCIGGVCVCDHSSVHCSIPPTHAENAACRSKLGWNHCCRFGCCTHVCWGCY